MSEIITEERILFFKKNLTTVLLAFAIVALVYMWIAVQDEKSHARDLEKQLNATKDARIIDQANLNDKAQKMLDLSIEVNKAQGQLIYFLKYGRYGIYGSDNDSAINIEQPKSK